MNMILVVFLIIVMMVIYYDLSKMLIHKFKMGGFLLLIAVTAISIYYLFI